jgi:hypothetical protein
MTWQTLRKENKISIWPAIRTGIVKNGFQVVNPSYLKKIKRTQEGDGELQTTGV